MFRAENKRGSRNTMRKVVVSTLAAILLSGAIQLPSHAIEMGDIGQKAIKFPMQMTSFVVGTIFGTPIAVGRKVMSNTKETCDNLGGDSTWKKAAAGVVALPVGLFKGGLEGLYLGPKNALYESGEKPFSKECFSLGDLDD